MNKDTRTETLIYLVLWALLFAAPVMSLYIRTGHSLETFEWAKVFVVWQQFAVFLVVFLIHNYLLAPMLVYRRQKLLYFSIVALLVGVFVVYQCNSRPAGNHPQFERADMRADGHRRPFDGDFGGHEPPPFAHSDAPRPPEFGGPRAGHQPPPFAGQHDLIAVVILILMLGMNLGVKLYFKQRRDERVLVETEKRNLEQQLEYLKYQINPHFLMNTLNNIHALVDIDQELAKETIVGLSKIMRFVLYEGSKSTVRLDRELAFLCDYIKLMQLRYSSDKVAVNVSMPDRLPDREIPPLLFITFVENAFKHGVSYRQHSFVDVACRIDGHDGKLVFACRNSKVPASEDKHGGVGLKNVRQRLDLIYGDRYRLDIDDQADTYNITLTIPL